LAIYDEYIERPGFLAAGLRPVVSKLREAIAENPEEPYDARDHSFTA